MPPDSPRVDPHRRGLALVDGRVWGLFAALTAATALALLLIAPRSDVVVIDSSVTEAVSSSPHERALRFAVAPVLSPERSAEDYLRLSGWLAERLGRPVRVVQRRTYGEINDLLRTSSVDLAIICTGAYLQGRANGLRVSPVVVPLPTSGPGYHSLIIVRADSSFETFEQVAQGRLAFADPLSLNGHFHPLMLALERGLDPAAVLDRAIHTYSHDNSIHAVNDGIVDGAAVDSLVWDYEVRHESDATGQLKVIERSASLPIQPLVAPDSLDPELLAAIREALLDLDEAPGGPEILQRLGLASFELPTPGLYDATAERIAPVIALLDGGS